MKNSTWIKKISVWMLAVCMLFSFMPVSVLADVIPADMVALSTPEDVLALAENCRLNTWSIGKTVVLNNDIDMTGTDFSGIPTFGGSFAGQGYAIKGVELTGDGSVVGLFRYLQSTAVVEDLSVEGIIQPKGSKSAVGGIAGKNAGIIRRCSFYGTVSGYEQIGGIAGVNETSGLIENCTANGMVYGSHFVGGFVGENHGVIRYSINYAEINTKSVQNAVSIEDVTLDTLMNTESAATTTDIGGIAGISSGVIRICANYGAVGYQSMGYNIGGIAGTQNGFVTECVNYADIQGRKEIGGIVGHMEPNIAVSFSEDSLQELTVQMDALEDVMGDLEGSMEYNSNRIDKQVSDIEHNLGKIENDVEILAKPINPETGEVDIDKLTAAKNDLSTSLNDVYKQSANLQQSMESAASDTEKRIEAVLNQLDKVMGTVDTLDEGIGLTMEDISGNDTPEDTIGKVSYCVNYAKIKGDLNIGGIAGIMAEENDLDDYEDTSIYGDFSLNVTGQVRVVVRGCKNFGTIAAAKNNAGGIAGQMSMGAVLESVNLGNLDALNADYVGGIAGKSGAVIRSCIAKNVIAGDSYVGGIAGEGEEVAGCYAFVSMKAYTEKAGAVLGDTEELPDADSSLVLGNYYFIEGKDIGGIDGISYAGATERVDLAGFLQIPGMDETLKTAQVRFVAEGQEDIVLTVNAGESLSMDAVPALSVEAHEEYNWKLVPAVTYEVLGMGETAAVEYISEESLSNILFDQTYEVSYGLKDTVIQSDVKNEENRTIILAEGTFAKNTTISLTDMLADEFIVNGEELLENWQVAVSNTGVTKLHYLISEGMDADAVKLLVKAASGKWTEREFVIDGSYMVFDFTDAESAFAFVSTGNGYVENMEAISIGIAVGIGIVVVFMLFGRILKKKHK